MSVSTQTTPLSCQRAVKAGPSEQPLFIATHPAPSHQVLQRVPFNHRGAPIVEQQPAQQLLCTGVAPSISLSNFAAQQPPSQRTFQSKSTALRHPLVVMTEQAHPQLTEHHFHQPVPLMPSQANPHHAWRTGDVSPSSHQQHLAAGYTADDARAFFEQEQGPQGSLLPSGKTVSTPLVPPLTLTTHYHPFRLAEPTEADGSMTRALYKDKIASDAKVIHPPILTTNPALVVNTNIDPTQYRTFWTEGSSFHTPVEYDSTSPDSSESYGASPLTPSGFDDAFSYDSVFERPAPLWQQGLYDGVRFGPDRLDTGPGSDLGQAPSLSSSFGSTSSHMSGFNSMCGPYVPSGLPCLPARRSAALPGAGTIQGMPDAMDDPTYDGADSDVVWESDDEGRAVFDASHQENGDTAGRRNRDGLLLHLRRQHFSYKDIKRIGGYHEAESTLRGRVRVLTKQKHERVRKPHWQQADVSPRSARIWVMHLVDLSQINLLSFAVKKLSSHIGLTPRGRKNWRKMPWKKISQWMKENGASYIFAPATCAKKWAEIKG